MTSNSKWDILLRSGHRIQNGIFGLEADIEFKMGYLYPGLFLTQAHWDPGPGSQAQHLAPVVGSLVGLDWTDWADWEQQSHCPINLAARLANAI